MNDDDLLRYSRQIMLSQIGYEGQQKIQQSHVLIMGLGGLGSPVALYLAAAGTGKLTLVDFDVVDLTNLQRQVIHSMHSLGQPKVESARQRLLEINPQLVIETHNIKPDADRLNELVQNADLVLDCTDNFTSRFGINAACVTHHKPLVSGAAIRFEGQVSVFDLRDDASPCYACLYQQQGDQQETCSETGILGPMVGIIGNIQALETLKLITQAGETLSSKLLICDGLQQDWRVMKLKKDPACPVCGPDRK